MKRYTAEKFAEDVDTILSSDQEAVDFPDSGLVSDQENAEPAGQNSFPDSGLVSDEEGNEDQGDFPDSGEVSK